MNNQRGDKVNTPICLHNENICMKNHEKTENEIEINISQEIQNIQTHLLLNEATK
jgi:hypothetical protein